MRIGWFVVVALLGCRGGGDATIDQVFDPCASLAITASEPSELESSGIDDALALWHDRGAPALAREADGAASLEIKFQDASAVFYGLYDDEAAVIYINRTITDRATLAIVIAHELGHAFGLFHIDDRPSVMSSGNLDVAPTLDDRLALEQLWGSCEQPAPGRAITPSR